MEEAAPEAEKPARSKKKQRNTCKLKATALRQFHFACKTDHHLPEHSGRFFCCNLLKLLTVSLAMIAFNTCSCWFICKFPASSTDKALIILLRCVMIDLPLSDQLILCGQLNDQPFLENTATR